MTTIPVLRRRARPVVAARRGLLGGPVWLPWALLLPALLFALTFKFIPMVEGLRMSLFKVQPFLGDEWVGLENYKTVLTDSRFRGALGHTLLLGVGQTAGALLLGFLLALLLEGSSRTLWVLRTAIFLPVVTAVAVIGEVWRILYFPSETGFVNEIAGWFGLGPFGFLSDPGQALVSVMIVGIWTAAPYNMVIILAGLTGIDRTLYEAAAVDGVSRWQRIRYIVIPGLRPAISVLLTLAAIRSLRIFTEVFVLTGGGPAGSTEVWMTRVFSLGFQRNDLGVASAASTLLLLVTVLLTLGMRLATSATDRKFRRATGAQARTSRQRRNGHDGKTSRPLLRHRDARTWTPLSLTQLPIRRTRRTR